MITCQECASEISEQDAFCPFCGIALTPAVVPSAVVDPTLTDNGLVEDDSLESTIMMPPEEIAAMKEIALKERASDTPVVEPGFEMEDEAEEVPDIPMPDLLSSTTDVPPPPTGLGSRTRLVSEDVSETEQPSDSTESPVVPAIGEPVIEDEVTPPSAEIAFEAEELGAIVVDEVGADPESTELVEPSELEDHTSVLAADAGSDDDSAMSFPHLDPIDDAEAVHVLIEQGTSEANSIEIDTVENDETSPEPGNEDKSSRPEVQIVKPVEELAAHDPFASGAMFDSVRIIENEMPAPLATESSSEPVEEAVTRIPSRPPTPEKVEQTGESREDVRSETSPNFGDTGTDGKRTSKLKPLTEGTILNNRYEIIRKIGGGGMGAVYLASDNNLGGVLRAVKEMVQSHIEEEQQEKAINDFKRESMILSTLDHPSIPTIFDYFFDEAESRFYLVMKYISGGDLSSRLRAAPEGKLEENTVCDWAIQVTDVLDYLHSQPSTIVYRDLKPSNIMIDGNSGRIMLIDFGIARSINQKEEKGVTAVGTMGYAPPELFSGNVEPRSDIYSLGSTMFHLLTGADPQSNPLLIFDFQKNPRPRQINPRLSDQMERILMRAVEYNSDARFSSAAEMRQALEDHAASLNGGGLTFGVTEAPAAVSLANQSVFCGFCGQRIVATDLFCAFCGSKQPLAQQGVQSEIYSKAHVTAKLFVEGTSDLSMPTYSLQKNENLVGRRDPMSNIFPEIDLSKYDPQTKISRRHARIWRDGSNFLVEDLGSSNGTVVARPARDSIRLIPHTPHALNSGDKLKIGDTTLHFLIG